jgi:hypothetical protein
MVQSSHAELGVLLKLVWLINMCLNETYTEVRIGKHLSDNFPIQNDLEQRFSTCGPR